MNNNQNSVFNLTKDKNNLTDKVNPFFVYFACWNILLIITLLLTSKYTSFVFINHLRSFPADLIMTFFTDLGNGIILIPLTVLFLFKKNYKVLTGLLLSALLNVLLVAALKHFFNEPRPLASYGNTVVQTAHWITLYSKYSYPSGHTACAFCMATYLALSFSRNRHIVMACFLAAALTGYSRVYLGEHFLQDVWVGSLIGVLIAVLSYKLTAYCFSTIQKRKAQL